MVNTRSNSNATILWRKQAKETGGNPIYEPGTFKLRVGVWTPCHWMSDRLNTNLKTIT